MAGNNTIHFILTGGTIDAKTYGKDRDILNEHSVIPEYLKSLKLDQKYDFTEIIWKDSRDITIVDREKILSIVEASVAQKIIITHGTFTLVDTAKFLKNNLSRKEQVIIFTGSLVPLKGFENSDAPLNLNFDMSKANKLPSGVYVCMNGEVFNPEQVIKDEITGKFVSKI